MSRYRTTTALLVCSPFLAPLVYAFALSASSIAAHHFDSKTRSYGFEMYVGLVGGFFCGLFTSLMLALSRPLLVKDGDFIQRSPAGIVASIAGALNGYAIGSFCMVPMLAYLHNFNANIPYLEPYDHYVMLRDSGAAVGAVLGAALMFWLAIGTPPQSGYRAESD